MGHDGMWTCPDCHTKVPYAHRFCQEPCCRHIARSTLVQALQALIYCAESPDMFYQGPDAEKLVDALETLCRGPKEKINDT